MPRKRTHEEMTEVKLSAEDKTQTLQYKIRNMWEFANLFQYIKLFGKAVKLDTTLEIEDFETQCIMPENSQLLEDMGLQLLKFVSSFRGLTYENWEEWVRRQYEQRRPGKPHPFGSDPDKPRKFRELDIFSKIRVLQQLTVWTFNNPDRIRSAMPEHDKEYRQFDDWGTHPVGWDKLEREYFTFADNRLYRRTLPSLPQESKAQSNKGKYTSKKAVAQRKRERNAKRRKLRGDDDEEEEETEINGDTEIKDEQDDTAVIEEEDDFGTANTFGDLKWECVATNLEEFTSFCDSLRKSKDTNEINLRCFVETDMMAELLAIEERKQRKLEAQRKELELQQKMLGAKRSGRLAAKQEREAEEAATAEEENRRKALLAEAKRDQQRQQQLDQDRSSRLQTREARIREREYARVLAEEKLKEAEKEEKRIASGESRRTQRNAKNDVERHRSELRQLEEDSADDWWFDCSVCHVSGKNFDDGAHAISCERCNVWQHSKCLRITQAEAEKDSFHFICKDCKKREKEQEDKENRPKTMLKFKLGNDSSPPQPEPVQPANISVNIPSVNGSDQHKVMVNLPPAVPGSIVNGQFYPAQPPQHAQAQYLPQPHMPGYVQHGVQQHARHDSLQNGQPYYPPQPYYTNGYPHQSPAQQHYLPPHRVQSAQTPVQRPSSSQLNGSSPYRPRVASPIINRPTMSPTQGNPDVGPIAGIPGSSPLVQPAVPVTPAQYGGSTERVNGHHITTPGVPNGASFTSNASFSASQPLSGLSPQKPRVSMTPQQDQSIVPQKRQDHAPAYTNGNGYTTPSASFSGAAGSFHRSNSFTASARSISGTPIFPPAENLAPSPAQLRPVAVPTPMKQVDMPEPSPPDVVRGNSEAPPVPIENMSVVKTQGGGQE